MRNILSKICIILAILFVLLGFASPFLIKNFIRIEGLQLNEITEWITSGMSACFSLSSICLVILNLNISGEAERKNQFQNKFFKLFDIWNGLRKRLPDDYFEKIVEELDTELLKIDYTILASDSMRDIAYDTCECYKKILKREKNRLEEYIECLFQIMLFVDTADIDSSEKKFCINFLGASLSGIEKKILYYHTINNSSGKDFHDIIEKYSILWNLDKKSIVQYGTINWYYEKRIYD